MAAKISPGADEAARGAGGLVQAAELNSPENSPRTDELQVARLRRRFGLPMPLARVIAAHAYQVTA